MDNSPRAQSTWSTARGALSLDIPRIMGIVNVTPDSFHDGGRYFDAEAAVLHAGALLEAGADVLDLGGESTRPGAQSVSEREELRRIRPVLRGVLQRWPGVLISVDTVKSEVARAALAEGAAIINDVSALRSDAAMADVVARAGAGLVLMHSRGSVSDMASYETAVYGADPVSEVVAELSLQVEQARQAGVQAHQIVLDPGIGFSKRTEQSVAVLARLDALRSLGYPVLIGPSRKRFLGELAGGLPADQRLEGTIAACVAGLLGGARIFRVHDVLPVRRALAVAEAIRQAHSHE
jgi:dihydropteroate synthase